MKEGPKWTDIAIVLLTAVIALTSYLQWHEIRAGGQDTHDLAVAAGKQADRMKDFSDRMKDQADRTKDLADRMKDQADQTKTIANQAVIQARAATSAAKTANESLHITERAEVEINGPEEKEIGESATVLQLVNIGHIPSGPVTVEVHEATLISVALNSQPGMNRPPALRSLNLSVQGAIESNWHTHRLKSVTALVPIGLPVPTVKADRSKLEAGTQTVFIVGLMTFNDGFPEDGTITTPFCYSTVVNLGLKKLIWSSCNPDEILPMVKKIDGWPNPNEQR